MCYDSRVGFLIGVTLLPSSLRVSNVRCSRLSYSSSSYCPRLRAARWTACPEWHTHSLRAFLLLSSTTTPATPLPISTPSPPVPLSPRYPHDQHFHHQRTTTHLFLYSIQYRVDEMAFLLVVPQLFSACKRVKTADSQSFRR